MLLTYDGQLYSVEAVQKAAYRSINYLNAEITLQDAKICCCLSPNAGITEEAFAHGVEEFKKDVLDYHLRIKLKAESEPLRNLILAIAFSKTGLQHSE